MRKLFWFRRKDGENGKQQNTTVLVGSYGQMHVEDSALGTRTRSRKKKDARADWAEGIRDFALVNVKHSAVHRLRMGEYVKANKE